MCAARLTLPIGHRDVIVRCPASHLSCPETRKFLPRLQFRNLLSEECLTRADDFIYDYTVRRVDRHTVRYANFVTTSATISRLSSALPKFVNLQSIRTVRGDAVIVTMPRDVGMQWGRQWEEAEWNSTRSCLTSTDVSE